MRFVKGQIPPKHKSACKCFRCGGPNLSPASLVGHAPWDKGIKRLDIRGEKHWHWKGGVPKQRGKESLTYEEYRKYLDWQKMVFRRDHWDCQKCGKHGGELHADHIRQWAKCPKLRYRLSNGRTLCPSCHRKTKSYGKKVV